MQVESTLFVDSNYMCSSVLNYIFYLPGAHQKVQPQLLLIDQLPVETPSI